jgi:hypothetical protein
VQFRSPRLGFALCTIVSVAAVGTAAAPAFADDGVPSLGDASAIAAAAAAGVGSADAADTAIPASVPDAADSPESVVVPVVTAPILPTIPDAGDPSPSTATTTTVATATTPASPPEQPQPQVPPLPQAPVTAPPSAPPPAAAPASDTGNTTSDNSNSITTSPPETQEIIPSQTFVWNWTWNCDPNVPPALPALPPGTTTIIWNWHWSCSDASPAPLNDAGVTICTSCNIAISVRIASPGDSGAIAQTIAAQAAATAADLTASVQQAAQLPPSPPPAAADTPPSSAAAPQSDLGLASAQAALPQFLIDDGPAGPSVSFVGEDAPRHGGEALSATPRAGLATVRNARASPFRPFRVQNGLIESRPAPPGIAEVVSASRATERRRSTVPVASPKHSLPPFVPAPARDLPLSTAVALAPPGVQHSSGSALVALEVGALELLLLLLVSYLVPQARVARARARFAEPHPPG